MLFASGVLLCLSIASFSTPANGTLGKRSGAREPTRGQAADANLFRRTSQTAVGGQLPYEGEPLGSPSLYHEPQRAALWDGPYEKRAYRACDKTFFYFFPCFFSKAIMCASWSVWPSASAWAMRATISS